MVDWLIANKEWVFSGVGVVIVVSIVGFIFRHKKNASVEQHQVSGKNSINVQGAGNINLSLNPTSEKKDVDK